MMLADTLQKVQTDEFESEIIDASKIDINQVTLKISKVADLSEVELQRIFKIFNKFKFVILECDPSPNPPENLLALKKYFGSIKRHKRSAQNGIVSIENLGDSFADANTYMSANNQSHLMHTDGTFENEPPKIIAMQCEISSKNGGLSQIVYGGSVYKYLLENYPQELQMFFTHPLTITRGEQTATRAMFVEEKGRILMTFRADSVISIKIPSRLEKVYKILKNYVNDPNNQLIFKLQANQIMLLDNTSVLHGRTSFPENEVRKVYRLCFDGISEYSRYLKFGFIPKLKLLTNRQN